MTVLVLVGAACVLVAGLLVLGVCAVAGACARDDEER